MLVSPQCFLPITDRNTILAALNLSLANTLNLVQSKNVLFSKLLKEKITPDYVNDDFYAVNPFVK